MKYEGNHAFIYLLKFPLHPDNKSSTLTKKKKVSLTVKPFYSFHLTQIKKPTGGHKASNLFLI